MLSEYARSRPEAIAVSLMNVHTSKGKEFDAVIIAEHRYIAPLPDPSRPPGESKVDVGCCEWRSPALASASNLFDHRGSPR